MSVFTTLQQHIQRNGALIVSCQPVPGSPMDSPEIVAAMATAAAQAESPRCVSRAWPTCRRCARMSACRLSIIKRDLDESPVRITPFLRDIDDLVQAGADIIAFDGTQRPRPERREALLARIQHHGRLAMADCSSLEDGLYCQRLGCDFIGTTLSGYTHGETPCEPDFALVHALSNAGCRVIAEGRYNTPAQAAQALSQGAWLSPSARPSPVLSTSVSGIARLSRRRRIMNTLAIDLGGTKLAAALVDANGQLSQRSEVATPVSGDPEALTKALSQLVTRYRGMAGRVAVASTGIIHQDPQRPESR